MDSIPIIDVTENVDEKDDDFFLSHFKLIFLNILFYADLKKKMMVNILYVFSENKKRPLIMIDLTSDSDNEWKNPPSISRPYKQSRTEGRGRNSTHRERTCV